jgi:hypothetical protein
MTSFVKSDGPHLFYVATNQHIYQYWWTGDAWTSQDQTSVTGGHLAAVGSALTSFSITDGDHIVYVDTSQHIHQLYYGSSGWGDQDLTAYSGTSQLAASGTALTNFVKSDGSHIWYLDTNRHLNQLWYTGTYGWVNQDITAGTGNHLAAVGSALTSFSIADGDHIVYVDASQHIHQLYYGSYGWGDQDLTVNAGTSTLAASGTALTSFVKSDGEHIWYLDTNRHLNQLWYTSSYGWVNQDITAAAGATLAVTGSALTSFSISDGDHIVYLDSSNHVHQLYYNNSGYGWGDQDLTALSATSRVAASGTALTSFVDIWGEHIFFVDSSQNMDELEYYPWTDIDVTQWITISGQATGAGGAAISGLSIWLGGSTDGSTTTSATGQYSFVVAGGGTYTLTASAYGGLPFSQTSYSFSNLSANQTANFTTVQTSLTKEYIRASGALIAIENIH